jgi:hypothetical protein
MVGRVVLTVRQQHVCDGITDPKKASTALLSTRRAHLASGLLDRLTTTL